MFKYTMYCSSTMLGIVVPNAIMKRIRTTNKSNTLKNAIAARDEELARSLHNAFMNNDS